MRLTWRVCQLTKIFYLSKKKANLLDIHLCSLMRLRIATMTFLADIHNKLCVPSSWKSSIDDKWDRSEVEHLKHLELTNSDAPSRSGNRNRESSEYSMNLPTSLGHPEGASSIMIFWGFQDFTVSLIVQDAYTHCIFLGTLKLS